MNRLARTSCAPAVPDILEQGGREHSRGMKGGTASCAIFLAKNALMRGSYFRNTKP